MSDGPDKGVQAAVSPGDLPKLQVKITEGTEGFVEGKPVQAGDVVELDFPAATNLVLIGHGEVIGTAKIAKAKGSK